MEKNLRLITWKDIDKFISLGRECLDEIKQIYLYFITYTSKKNPDGLYLLIVKESSKHYPKTLTGGLFVDENGKYTYEGEVELDSDVFFRLYCNWNQKYRDLMLLTAKPNEEENE